MVDISPPWVETPHSHAHIARRVVCSPLVGAGASFTQLWFPWISVRSDLLLKLALFAFTLGWLLPTTGHHIPTSSGIDFMAFSHYHQQPHLSRSNGALYASFISCFFLCVTKRLLTERSVKRGREEEKQGKTQREGEST